MPIIVYEFLERPKYSWKGQNIPGKAQQMLAKNWNMTGKSH
jgi:hypothetical protein